MHKCPKCGEELEDQFDLCWRCAGKVPDSAGEDTSTTEQRDFFEYRNTEGKVIYRKVIADVFAVLAYSYAIPGFLFRSGGLLLPLVDRLFWQYVSMRPFIMGFSYFGPILPPILYAFLPAGSDKKHRLIWSAVVAVCWSPVVLL